MPEMEEKLVMVWELSPPPPRRVCKECNCECLHGNITFADEGGQHTSEFWRCPCCQKHFEAKNKGLGYLN